MFHVFPVAPRFARRFARELSIRAQNFSLSPRLFRGRSPEFFQVPGPIFIYSRTQNFSKSQSLSKTYTIDRNFSIIPKDIFPNITSIARVGERGCTYSGSKSLKFPREYNVIDGGMGVVLADFSIVAGIITVYFIVNL